MFFPIGMTASFNVYHKLFADVTTLQRSGQGGNNQTVKMSLDGKIFTELYYMTPEPKPAL